MPNVGEVMFWLTQFYYWYLVHLYLIYRLDADRSDEIVGGKIYIAVTVRYLPVEPVLKPNMNYNRTNSSVLPSGSSAGNTIVIHNFNYVER